MILRYDGEIESTSDESKCESMTTLEDASNVEYVVNSDFFVIRRYLNVQVSKEHVEHQRKNIFHTWCHIKIRMIIDNGSCIMLFVQLWLKSWT